MPGIEKNSMDVIDTYATARVLNEKLKGCYLDNFYSAGFYWVMKIRCKEGLFNVKIEPGVRFHVSNLEPGEKKVDPLTIFIRRGLGNARITGITQLGWERIVLVNLSLREGSYNLIVELLPRGVLVVSDPENRIVFASRRVEMKDRAIKTGLVYKPPPSLGKSPFSEDLVDTLYGFDTLIKGVTRGWGLPGYIGEEILYRAGLFEKKSSRPSDIARSDLNILTEKYREVVKEAESGKCHLVYTDEERLTLYTLFKPSLLVEEYGLAVKEADLVSGIDFFFGEYEKRVVKAARERELETKRKEIEKSIASVYEAISQFEESKKEFEKILQAVYTNYYQVEEDLKCAQEAHDKHGWNSVVKLCSNIVSVDQSRGLVLVKAGDTIIPLDIRLDLARNIIEVKKKLGEIEKKLETALEKKKDLENRLKEVERELSEKLATSIRPREWYERFHWLITRNGFLAIGGKDADQNELIYRKYMADYDIFLHADIHGAPVVVLKTYRKTVSEEDIRDAAYLTACYSKAWKAGFSFVDVYWVRGEQVSKTPPSGEYLPKGSFMIYGKRNYLTIPLELAIGIEKVVDHVYGEYWRTIVGPEELVEKKAVSYAVIKPSNKPVEEIAREIYDRIVKGDVRAFVSLREIQSRIPGPSAVVRFRS
ncbi:ribosome rescue protein RqcH [Thermogladius sp. 4427co]|uniref:ribosome rescue protein RqcH n=1 Tax=Thermogladius sp. 4427co TaxID=3450718 RepID=UPI003F78EB17